MSIGVNDITMVALRLSRLILPRDVSCVINFVIRYYRNCNPEGGRRASSIVPLTGRTYNRNKIYKTNGCKPTRRIRPDVDEGGASFCARLGRTSSNGGLKSSRVATMQKVFVRMLRVGTIATVLPKEEATSTVIQSIPPI